MPIEYLSIENVNDGHLNDDVEYFSSENNLEQIPCILMKNLSLDESLHNDVSLRRYCF